MDPAKVQAIRDTTTPQSASEVRSFLGMANYCSRFIPHLATLSEPLRQLPKKKAVWRWLEKEENAFNEIKEALCHGATVAYFTPGMETELIVDASPVGLGALLVQKNKEGDVVPIAYASRALSSVEMRYAQIEREALAIKWGCSHFDLYLCGHNFKVVTDHKPLISLFTGTARNGPPRIERWAVQIQHYKFQVVFRPGVNNPADYFSRHPLAATPEEGVMAEKQTEVFIQMIVEDNCPKALTLTEIQTATEEDVCLQDVLRALRTKDWKLFLQGQVVRMKEDREARECLWKCRDELCEGTEGILLRGDRIVIPQALWAQTVELAHQGHQGVEKTKARIRTKVWFPKVDDLVEARVKECHACIVAEGDPPVSPVITEPAVSRPWSQVSLDFGSFPDGQHTVVIVDGYSKFPVVEVMSSTAFEALKPVLNRVFALLGLPDVVRTDNGPPFEGAQFQEYLAQLGVKHRKITPQWPQANGDVERFMRTLNKVLRIAVARKEDLEECLQSFLRAYRNTPHSTTKCAPRDLLMPWGGRDVVPASPGWRPTTLDPIAVQNRRRNTNEKASLQRRARSTWFQPRDRVVVRSRRPGWKFGTRYETKIWEVVSQKGTMVTARRGGTTITRNVLWFKRVPGANEGLELGSDGDELHPDQMNLQNEDGHSQPRSLCREDGVGETGGSCPNSRDREWSESQITERSHHRYQLRTRPVLNSQLKDYDWKGN